MGAPTPTGAAQQIASAKSLRLGRRHRQAEYDTLKAKALACRDDPDSWSRQTTPASRPCNDRVGRARVGGHLAQRARAREGTAD